MASKPNPKGTGPGQGPKKLLKGVGAASSSASRKRKKKKGKKKAAPKPAQTAKRKSPKKPKKTKDPIAVATGVVLDEHVDLALPGAIALEWRRLYASDRADERSPLGKGGWTVNLDQWIERQDDGCWTYRAEDGRDIYFPLVEPGQSAFHRGERLTLRIATSGNVEVESADTRLVRVFTPSKRADLALLRAIRDPWGNAIDLFYDPSEQLVRVRDTAGRTLRILWARLPDDPRPATVVRVEIWSAAVAATPQTVAVEPVLCQWVDYAYAAGGELARVTDALGGAYSYRYDGEHRLTGRTLPTGLSFRFEYDEETGRCIRNVGDGGLFDSRLSFDDAKRTTYLSGNQEPRRFVWNDAGLVVREETLGGEWAHVTDFDADDYLVREANAAGEATSYRYDARGNLVERVDPAGNRTRWVVAADRPTRRIEPDGLETQYDYDGRGALVGVAYPTGQRFVLSYDGAGRLTAIHGQDGLVAGFAYDAQHNLVQEVDGRGAVLQYVHDALGRPVASRDALGRVTRVDYDALGRPTAVHRPDGTTTRVEHDALGRVARFVDAEGHATTLEYSGIGALTRLVEPTGQDWRLTYDELERLTRIENPRRERYDYEYDDAGRITRETSFHHRRMQYAYDKASNLARVDYSDETYQAFKYDRLGNLLADRSPHGDISFERDPLGRLTRAVVAEYNGKVVTSFERDRFGRVVAETQGDKTLRYEYDDRGRRAARVLPGGETTRYRYDPTGAFVGVEHDGQQVAVERDILGREIRRTVRRGGVVIESGYDAADRLVDQRVGAPAPAGGGVVTELARRRWHYDPNGRPTAIEDARWGTTTYRHDPLGQLLEATRGRHREAFDYDVTGSLQNALTDLAQADLVHPWRTAPGNLLTETAVADYENDGQGRRTAKVPKHADGTPGDAASATKYVWDCRDRLREVRLPDGRRVLYTYDAFARRVRKEVVPAERRDIGAMVRLAYDRGKDALPKIRRTEYVWDGDALAAELADDGAARVFVHEPGTLVPMLQAEQGEVFTVVNDHLGMPKELVDADGRLAWAAAHSAWGSVVETWRDERSGRGERARPVESPFRLLGQFLDADTGLACTRFRWFDAETGRWMSPDPLGFAGGRNLLAFARSPVWLTDAMGLCPDEGGGEPDKPNELERLPKKGRALFRGMEVRGMRDLSHVSSGRLQVMAEDGFAARDHEGRPLQLHHMNQSPEGPIVEIPGENHSIWNKKQHPLGNVPGSGLNDEQRSAFGDWRREYWKARAREELKKRGR